VDAGLFRRIGVESPQAIERVGIAAMSRRAELERARSDAGGTAIAVPPATFLARMKKFLRMN
jgi:hypothetical protein